MYQIGDAVISTIDPNVKGTIVGYAILPYNNDTYFVVQFQHGGFIYNTKNNVPTDSGVYVSSSVWHIDSIKLAADKIMEDLLNDK